MAKTTSGVIKVVAVVLAVGAVAAVVAWAQSRGAPPIAAVTAPAPALVPAPAPNPAPAPAPAPTPALAPTPAPAVVPAPTPARNTYFSTSKSAFAPSFDDPQPQAPAIDIGRPGPDAR